MKNQPSNAASIGKYQHYNQKCIVILLEIRQKRTEGTISWVRSKCSGASEPQHWKRNNGGIQYSETHVDLVMYCYFLSFFYAANHEKWKSFVIMRSKQCLLSGLICVFGSGSNFGKRISPQVIIWLAAKSFY